MLESEHLHRVEKYFKRKFENLLSGSRIHTAIQEYFVNLRKHLNNMCSRDKAASTGFYSSVGCVNSSNVAQVPNPVRFRGYNKVDSLILMDPSNWDTYISDAIEIHCEKDQSFEEGDWYSPTVDDNDKFKCLFPNTEIVSNFLFLSANYKPFKLLLEPYSKKAYGLIQLGDKPYCDTDLELISLAASADRRSYINEMYVSQVTHVQYQLSISQSILPHIEVSEYSRHALSMVRLREHQRLIVLKLDGGLREFILTDTNCQRPKPFLKLVVRVPFRDILTNSFFKLVNDSEVECMDDGKRYWIRSVNEHYRVPTLHISTNPPLDCDFSIDLTKDSSSDSDACLSQNESLSGDDVSDGGSSYLHGNALEDEDFVLDEDCTDDVVFDEPVWNKINRRLGQICTEEYDNDEGVHLRWDVAMSGNVLSQERCLCVDLSNGTVCVARKTAAPVSIDDKTCDAALTYWRTFLCSRNIVE